MMSIESKIFESIKSGDLIKVLRGDDGLSISFNQMVGAAAPTDWTRVLPIVYEVAKTSGNNIVLNKLEECIKELLLGTAEDVYIGVSVLYIQLIKETRGESPFEVNRELLARNASDGIKREEMGLKESSAWSGQYSDEGLWPEIQRYKKLMYEKYKLEL